MPHKSSARLIYTEDTIRCEICLCVPNVPVVGGCCTAIYCQAHIATWINSHSSCPSCRQPLQASEIIETRECTENVGGLSAKCVECGLEGTMHGLKQSHSEAVCKAALRTTTPMRVLCKYKQLKPGDIVEVFYSYKDWSFFVESVNKEVIHHVPSNYLEPSTNPLERELTLREMNECVASCPEIDPLLSNWFKDRGGWVDKVQLILDSKISSGSHILADGIQLDIMETIDTTMRVFKTDSQVLQTCFTALLKCLGSPSLENGMTCSHRLYITIRDAMRMFPNRSALQKGALMLLHKLTDRRLTHGPHYITECDLLADVVKVMQRFPNIREVQLHACHVLINACLSKSATATILVVRLNIQQHLQTLMERPKLWPDVFLGVCSLVSELCEASEAVSRKVQVMLDPYCFLVQSKHFKLPGEMRTGIQAFVSLNNTGADLKNWAEHYEEHPDTSVIPLVCLFPEHADLQTVAFSAIKALSAYDAEGLAGFTKENLLSHIKTLQKHHAKNKQLMDLVEDVQNIAREVPDSHKRKITEVSGVTGDDASRKHGR